MHKQFFRFQFKTSATSRQHSVIDWTQWESNHAHLGYITLQLTALDRDLQWYVVLLAEISEGRC